MNTSTQIAAPVAKPRRISLKERERQDAIARLHEILQPGDTVYTICRHVSRSGMMRHIEAYLIKDSERVNLTYLIAAACDYRRTDGGALKVTGCGMDMGFSVVYDLSRTMYPSGHACTGERCPSNDHSNGLRDRTPGANHHNSGGYALSHRWL